MKKLHEMVLYYRAVDMNSPETEEKETDHEEESAKRKETDYAGKTAGIKERDSAEKFKIEDEKKIRMIKSVLVRMGVRIRNVGPEQVLEKVGYLAGIPGYEALPDVPEEELPYIGQEVLVMKNFTSSRIDALLAALRKAGVPKIELKAVITPQNVDWSFYRLYQELLEEHRVMGERNGKNND